MSKTDIPLPPPLYQCKHCREDYSRPASDLHWSEQIGAWVCIECWDNEVHGARGASLDEEINRRNGLPAPSASVFLGKVCSVCGEPAGHTLGNCPACQDIEAIEEEFLRTRKLLHKLATHFGETCSHPLAEAVRERLRWPNARPWTTPRKNSNDLH